MKLILEPKEVRSIYNIAYFINQQTEVQSLFSDMGITKEEFEALVENGAGINLEFEEEILSKFIDIMGKYICNIYPIINALINALIPHVQQLATDLEALPKPKKCTVSIGAIPLLRRAKYLFKRG